MLVVCNPCPVVKLIIMDGVWQRTSMEDGSVSCNMFRIWDKKLCTVFYCLNLEEEK